MHLDTVSHTFPTPETGRNNSLFCFNSPAYCIIKALYNYKQLYCTLLSAFVTKLLAVLKLIIIFFTISLSILKGEDTVLLLVPLEIICRQNAFVF